MLRRRIHHYLVQINCNAKVVLIADTNPQAREDRLLHKAAEPVAVANIDPLVASADLLELNREERGRGKLLISSRGERKKAK